ncbi:MULTISPECIES: hypothetical protein [Chitinophagaceae]|uniref:hypothetical protein n=1 Tax=Chitinophagaceae TaxID=563835 RepID=UPI000DEF8639|nr:MULTISPECIES: hypothetical protein [Chitinophagaceae]RPD48096.1 hypothetical protein DRJ53_10115 [Paracnuella aquatica]
MGRIFTVDFSFEGRQYTAFVKITTASDLFSVHIQVPDTTLHHLIPNGTIMYKSTEGLSSLQRETNGPSYELISRIVQAIERYLEQ